MFFFYFYFAHLTDFDDFDVILEITGMPSTVLAANLVVPSLNCVGYVNHAAVQIDWFLDGTLISTGPVLTDFQVCRSVSTQTLL